MRLMRLATLPALLLTLLGLLLTPLLTLLQLSNPDSTCWTRRGLLTQPPFFWPMARATLLPHWTPNGH